MVAAARTRTRTDGTSVTRGMRVSCRLMPDHASPPAARASSLQDFLWVPALQPARDAVLRLLRRTYASRWPVLGVREELPHLLNRRGLRGCGVEVGVKRGEFSELMLDAWSGCHLISVDPWAEAPGEYVDVANVHQEQHERFLAETRARLQRFGPRSTIWRMTGEDAAPRVPHHSLDFVYIDARHDHDSVLADIGDWFDKVRPGGVIAGHDYVDGRFEQGVFGVRGAVDDFFGRIGLPVHATFADGPFVSWYVVLPARTSS